MLQAYKVLRQTAQDAQLGPVVAEGHRQTGHWKIGKYDVISNQRQQKQITVFVLLHVFCDRRGGEFSFLARLAAVPFRIRLRMDHGRSPFLNIKRGAERLQSAGCY